MRRNLSFGKGVCVTLERGTNESYFAGGKGGMERDARVGEEIQSYYRCLPLSFCIHISLFTLPQIIFEDAVDNWTFWKSYMNLKDSLWSQSKQN